MDRAPMDSAPWPIHVERLQEELRNALRHGARAARLFTYSRGLIDALVPPRGGDPQLSLSFRAIAAENIIKAGIENVGGNASQALSIALALRGDAVTHRKLEDRRREAAQIFGIQPNTFRLTHESILLWDLTFEIYKLLLQE